MEKALDRQRILLRHLEPAAGTNPTASAVSVRSFSLSTPLRRRAGVSVPDL